MPRTDYCLHCATKCGGLAAEEAKRFRRSRHPVRRLGCAASRILLADCGAHSQPVRLLPRNALRRRISSSCNAVTKQNSYKASSRRRVNSFAPTDMGATHDLKSMVRVALTTKPCRRAAPRGKPLRRRYCTGAEAAEIVAACVYAVGQC